MNESIIRRFARYHGRHYAITHPCISTDEAIADLVEHLRTTERNVIQSIARIEDAEMLLARIESFSVPLLATSQEAKALREFYAFDAARLLAMAGIDPELWAKGRE